MCSEMGTRTVQLRLCCILLEKQLVCVQSAIFFQSDAEATKFSLHVFVQLLFEGGCYSRAEFISLKPADINDGHTSKTVTNVRSCQ